MDVYVVATFKHSNSLELSLTELEQKGIGKDQMMAIPLQEKKRQQKLFDTINYADGISLFDGAAALGTVFMTLGTIYGYVWHGGPILWGLAGLFAGALLGGLADYLIGKKRGFKKRQGCGEVVLLIRTTQDNATLVEQILWDNHALAIGFVRRNCTKYSGQL